MYYLSTFVLHVSVLTAPSSGRTFFYASNQHVTTRTDTHKQRHNKTWRPREGFVPSGQ